MTTVTLTVGTGTQQWSPPADCLVIDLIEIWGPGGSGGKRAARVTGGGSGAYVSIPGPIPVSQLVTAGTVPYQTGRGGAAQSTATTAGNPGTAKSWFYSSTVFAADLGLGGLASGTTTTAGGAGGLVANCIPTWAAKAGGNGGTDASASGASAGGASGSSAGVGVNGAAISTAVAGGTTTAPAGGGNGGAASITSSNATAGSSPGGGGGAINNASGSSGAGADGQIVITYTPNNTATQTWNPAHAAASASFSNNDLTVTATIDGAATVFGTVGKSAGKYYWEVTFNNPNSSTSSGVGIGQTTSSTATFSGADTTSFGWFHSTGSGTIWYNALAQSPNWADFGNANGTLVCLALDLDNKKIWGRIGTAGNWNNDVIGNQNPATNTGGFALPAGLYAADLYPSCCLAHVTTAADVFTGAFDSASWTGTAPSGFISFNASGVTSQPIVVRSPFRLLPGKGPRPLVPQPWYYYTPLANAAITATQDDQTSAITATISAEPIATRSPFRLLPGRGPRPLVPQPWRYYVQNANAVVAATQDDQTVSAASTNLDHAAVAQTQDDQTVTATATLGAEPIASRSPFRLLPGKGPRPLVPQPWRYYTPLANAAVTATQDDQTSSITATIGAEPIAVRSPFRLLPGRGPRPLVPNPWRGDFSVPSGGAVIAATQDDQIATIAATNLDHAVIVQTQADQTASITGTVLDTAVIAQTQADQTIAAAATNASHAVIAQTQDDQTAAITASIGAVPIAVRSPFRLLPGRGPRPLVPNPWRYVVPADVHASIIQTQDDQTISATATQADAADIDQNQDDHTISSTATLLVAAAIAQTQSNQTIVSVATNRTHAAIVQTQDDQTIVATALRLLPRTAAIVQTQQDQTIRMAAGQPRVTVAQPQFLW